MVKSKEHHAVCDLFAYTPYLPQGLYRLAVVAGFERIEINIAVCYGSGGSDDILGSVAGPYPRKV